MYYKEDDINRFLNCPSCSQTFDDPRLIPCGECLCNHCIQDMVIQETNGFQCEFCSSFHQVPEEGFAPVKFLQKLKSKKPCEVYRSKTVEDFKTNLHKIKQTTEELEASYRISSDKLKEYCDFIRYDIELVTESIISEINMYRDTFINTVDSYEQDGLKNIESNSIYKNDFESFMLNMNTFFSTWNQALKQHKIDETEVEKALVLSNNHLNKLNLDKNKLKFFQFNGKILKFKGNSENINSNVLGAINFENLLKQ